MKRFFGTIIFIFSMIMSVFGVSFINKTFNITISNMWLVGEWFSIFCVLLLFFNALLFKGELFEVIKSESEKLEYQLNDLREENKLLKKKIKELEKKSI